MLASPAKVWSERQLIVAERRAVSGRDDPDQFSWSVIAVIGDALDNERDHERAAYDVAGVATGMLARC
ncbi:MAG: hypothetical protein ACRDRI_12690 [Pseudonocardiaceae bacterium]